MHIFLGCLILAAGSIVLAPSSQDLQKKYGEPVSGHFAVTSGVSLTVQFGPDNLVCHAVIEPPASLANKNGESVLMPAAVVSDVIAVVAPASIRGKQLNEITSTDGCNIARITDYENVTIARMTHECLPMKPDQDVRASINFKRAVCQKLKTPSQ